MAIERLKKVTMLFPDTDGERFEKWLYRCASVHLVDFQYEESGVAGRLKPFMSGEPEAADNLVKVKELINELNEIHRKQQNFIDSMLPVKTVVCRAEMLKALQEIDVTELRKKVREIKDRIHEIRSEIESMERERLELGKFDFLKRPLSEIREMKKVFLIVAEGNQKKIESLERDSEAAEHFAWEVARRNQDRMVISAVGSKTAKEKATDILRAGGFRILDIPCGSQPTAKRLGEIGERLKVLRAEMSEREEEERRVLGPELETGLTAIRGFWESERRRVENARKMLSAGRVGVAAGFIRSAAAGDFSASLEKDFPGVSIIEEDPDPSEKVPVSIKLPKFFRPAQLLISMFGFPNYFSIDPTPYLMFVFLSFFGICFADVLYGSMLAWVGWILMRRYYRQENLREFFRLFFYCGISTIVWGVITGSWASNIYEPQYLGENNFLLRIVHKTTIIDMLSKPVLALVAVLALGVMNQFYGIVIRIIKEARRRNWRGAIYDGVLWLVYLGALLFTAISLIGGFGRPGLVKGGAAVAALSALGLVLTQGRDQKSWGGRIVVGVVSLYGIMGGYGTTTFIGDVLSYSRLLALGLNTYIVGMAFNIIAKIVPQILVSLTSILNVIPEHWFIIGLLNRAQPYLVKFLSFPLVSGVIIVVCMICGHLFNFIMSILSAFVHSARLILLEFFGRFYQGDGGEFQPHGFVSDTVELAK